MSPAAAGARRAPAGAAGDLWRPRSACGAHCRPGTGARVPAVVAVLRLARLLGLLLLAAPLLAARGAVPPAVARAALAALGVRVVWRGPRPAPGSLVVANHVSWLDVVALLAVVPARLVAKREVAAWPGVGALAARAGTIFVDRARPRTLPGTVTQVAAALRAGRTVAAFPEGTTSCGAARGRFRPALFEAALAAGAPVAPVTIRYDSRAAAFVGDDTLLGSLRRVARLDGLTVTLRAAGALHPADGADRRLLARAAQASVG